MTRETYLFEPKFRVDETLAELRECLEKGGTGFGYKTLDFERAWCEFSGLPCAHFVNSATAGLHLAVRILKEHDGWQEGDEVISTPFTFVSTNHVLLHERLRPVFADLDEHLCLSPDSVRARLTRRTRAVMFVGHAGNPGRLEEIAALCREHGIRLILDAAHMTGTRIHGRHVGGEADVSVFSFHAVKNLPTADSGMLCFREPSFDREARKWSWLGIDKDTFTRMYDSSAYKWMYGVEHVGFKYHGNSIMAALGLVSLRYVDQDNAYRRQLAGWYEHALAGCGQVTGVPIPSDCEPSRHLFQVLVPNRNEVMLALNRQGIYPGVHYRINTDYPMYADQRGTCPKAELASESVVSLPLHLGLAHQDVTRVAETLAEVLRSSTPQARTRKGHAGRPTASRAPSSGRAPGRRRDTKGPRHGA
jgi:dTDP-4-amino-4,6-dideoxygalactose transaminase